MRTCIYCKKNKEEVEFSKRKNFNRTDTVYYHPVCGECGIKKMNEWKEKNRAKFLAYQREYSRTHRQK